MTKIALIEDHVLLRNGLAGLINSFEDFRVSIEADHGRDFIQQLEKEEEPDIALLDVTMPVMNGFETADWIHENLKHTRVLVLSMIDSEAVMISMLKKGARGYLFKDSKPDVFRQALQDVRDTGFYMNDRVSSKVHRYISEPDRQEPGIRLTSRELEFLKLTCSEMPYKEIAQNMGVSPRTVDSYRDTLFDKLGVTSRVGFVLFAIKNGIFNV